MLQKIVNTFALLLVLAINYLANALPINGMTTGELSDKYPNLFVPAGFTFSIWGVIYLLLIVFVVAQFVYRNEQTVKAVGWLFALSCLLNVSWILLWHYEQLVLSLIVMGWLLRSLVTINQNIIHERDRVSQAAFGVYLGWICIATIANATAVLVSVGWNGFGLSEQFWTILLIAVGAGITVWLVGRMDNSFLAMAVAWAFLGIMLKRLQDYPVIAFAAVAGLVLMIGLILFRYIRQRKPAG